MKEPVILWRFSGLGLDATAEVCYHEDMETNDIPTAPTAEREPVTPEELRAWWDEEVRRREAGESYHVSGNCARWYDCG